MILILIALFLNPAIQFIFLLLPQYADITLHQECNQSLQSHHGCSYTTTTHTKSQFLQHPHILLTRLIHQLLLLQARFEHFRNSISTTLKKCKLKIVNEHALTIFHKNFPLTQFLFHFLFYSVLVFVTSCLSVSCFGCLKTSCRIFRRLVTIILV
jgi:hypothetical protein